MKRALMYASVAAQIHHFNMENIRLLQELGYKVDVACNMDSNGTIAEEKITALRKTLEMMDVRIYHIPLTRKITDISALISSVQKTRKIITENKYSIIHCHSPISSVVCRIANRLSTDYQKRKLIYTAHGFHFFKGAPASSWMLYYPVEKLCSQFTNLLITINQEDYLLAKRKMKSEKVEYVPGVGINVRNFEQTDIDVQKKKTDIGIPENSFVLLSVGELNSNKNHEVVIRAMENLSPDVHYVIAGKGELSQYLKGVAQKCGLENRVHLLGFRSDVAELVHMSDLFVFPSYREGLPVSIMEAMAAGKAIVASRIRGNIDLVDVKGGCLVSPENCREFSDAIGELYFDADRRKQMELYNREKAKQYDVDRINKQMKKIYTDIAM